MKTDFDFASAQGGAGGMTGGFGHRVNNPVRVKPQVKALVQEARVAGKNEHRG